MKEILKFLKSLAGNNNREWFLAHKDEYLKVKTQIDELTALLIAGVASFEPEAAVSPLQIAHTAYIAIHVSPTIRHHIRRISESLYVHPTERG